MSSSEKPTERAAKHVRRARERVHKVVKEKPYHVITLSATTAVVAGIIIGVLIGRRD